MRVPPGRRKKPEAPQKAAWPAHTAQGPGRLAGDPGPIPPPPIGSLKNPEISYNLSTVGPYGFRTLILSKLFALLRESDQSSTPGAVPGLCPRPWRSPLLPASHASRPRTAGPRVARPKPGLVLAYVPAGSGIFSPFPPTGVRPVQKNFWIYISSDFNCN